MSAEAKPVIKSPSQKPRAWQRMLSGRRLDLLDPSPLDIEIDDIAHGLARVPRWNGQTVGAQAFSVAQHSVLVENIVSQLRPNIPVKWRLAALLHDAAEYVVGDMISPFKSAMGGDYKAVEERLDAAIRLRFGLPAALPVTTRDLIKRADKICAHVEAVRLAGFTKAEADKFFIRPPADLTLDADPLPTADAQAIFLARFERLSAEIDA